MVDYKIYTFLELCKNMNYRVTSEVLNMSQPAVTNHIKQLEEDYGCKLFIYKNRTLYKTKEADILENYARSADYSMQKLLNELKFQEKPTLKIGATKTIGEYIINNQISNLLSKVDLDLTYIVDNTQILLKKLQKGDLDFIFVEGFINKEDYEYFTYKQEKLVGICAENHRFANKELDIEEIFSNRLILREEGSGTREAFERILKDFNLTINSFSNKIATNSFKTITELVAKDFGISFVYQSVAECSENIAKFKIKNSNSWHEFTCIHLKNTPNPAFIEYFIE